MSSSAVRSWAPMPPSSLSTSRRSSGKLTGRIDGGFDIDMTGDTLGHALKASRGHAVVGMITAASRAI